MVDKVDKTNLRERLLRAASEPHGGADRRFLARALDFVSERLPATDFDEFLSLLLAAYSPGHAARLNEESAR